MQVAYWIAWLAAAYLYGSVSYALIFTRLRTGKDIRSLGNRNAGAANVRRTLGLGWGVLVFFLDLSKSLLPMAGAELSTKGTSGIMQAGILVSVGLAAFAGHCRPLYYGFRGGRGIATSIGIFAWLAPVELIAAMLIGVLLVLLLVHDVEHRIGPYTPIAFVTLTPLFTLAASLTVDFRLAGSVSLGGHPWYIVAGVFLVSIVILAVNLPFLTERSRELRSAPGGGGLQKFDQ